jgi:hypothetical protein
MLNEATTGIGSAAATAGNSTVKVSAKKVTRANKWWRVRVMVLVSAREQT